MMCSLPLKAKQRIASRHMNNYFLNLMYISTKDLEGSNYSFYTSLYHTIFKELYQ